MTDNAMSPTPPYKMGTIVRLTSFAPQRLRAWEHRYDLLRPCRGEGGHRLYSEDDLRVLCAVREFLGTGRTIGEINRIGRDAILDGTARPHRGRTKRTASAQRVAAEDIPLEADTLVSRLVKATLAMDESELQRILDQAFSAMSAEVAIDRVIAASLRRIGNLWADGLCTISSEHLATRIFTHRVRTLFEHEASANLYRKPRVLCGCFPQERHELGILALSYSLALRKARVTVLGSEVPLPDLERACLSTAAEAVLLSVSDDALYSEHKAGLLELRSRIGPRTRIVLGGAGVPAGDADLSGTGVTVITCSDSLGQTAESLLADLRGRAASARKPESKRRQLGH